jgi:hypothetical protein
MPIKSKAQRRKFAELLMKGEISEEVYERWNRGAGYKELPERVKSKEKSKGQRKAPVRSSAKTKKKTAKSTSRTKKRATSTRKTKKRSTGAR